MFPCLFFFPPPFIAFLLQKKTLPGVTQVQCSLLGPPCCHQCHEGLEGGRCSFLFNREGNMLTGANGLMKLQAKLEADPGFEYRPAHCSVLCSTYSSLFPLYLDLPRSWEVINSLRLIQPINTAYFQCLPLRFDFIGFVVWGHCFWLVLRRPWVP